MSSQPPRMTGPIDVGGLVGNPDWAGRREGQPPGTDQVRVGHRVRDRAVGDEVRLDINIPARAVPAAMTRAQVIEANRRRILCMCV